MIFSTLLGVAILGQVVFTGSELSLEQAQKKANSIVVATPVTRDLLGSGPTWFGEVDLQRPAVLKGQIKEERLKRVSISGSGPETAPMDGKEYLVFLGEFKGHPSIIKMLPNTAENIEAVKKEIEAKEKPSR